MHLSPEDVFTARDAMEGISIIGATGSGKSSGPGKAVAQAFLCQGSGRLVLAAKPGEAQTWNATAMRRGGRKASSFFLPRANGALIFWSTNMPTAGTVPGCRTTWSPCFSPSSSYVTGRNAVTARTVSGMTRSSSFC